MALALRRHVDPPAERATAGRPNLALAQRRRRWPAVVTGLLFTIVLAGMFGAAVFHTQLAERQLRIDRLERQVDDERERFDELRHERATLRSPGRLAAEAGALGMVRGDASEFVEVEPLVLARQLAAAGSMAEDDVRQIVVETEPLDQFRDVKSVSAGQP